MLIEKSRKQPCSKRFPRVEVYKMLIEKIRQYVLQGKILRYNLLFIFSLNSQCSTLFEARLLNISIKLGVIERFFRGL